MTTTNQDKFIKLMINQLNSMYNLELEKTPENIGKYREEIYNIIKKRYKSTNTIKSYLNNLGTILKKVLKKHIQDADRYISEATYNNNKAVNETLIDSDKCQLLWSDFKDEFLKYSRLYLEDPTNIKKMNLFLILALNFLQPPLRRTINNMKIIGSLKADNMKDNFLYIKSKNEAYYIINNDKVSGLHKERFISINQTALDCIILTLENIPRYILITNNEGTSPASFDSYQRYLDNIFKNYSCRITQNSLRSSYVTALLDRRNKQEIKKTAEQMRSSIELFTLNYDRFGNKTATKKND